MKKIIWIKFNNSLAKFSVLLICISLVIFLEGCNRKHPSSNRYTNRNVDISELTGIWKISDASLKILKKEGYKKYINKEDFQLLLKSDMTCEISTFSYIPYSPTPQDENENYISKKIGKWKVVKTGKYSGENKDVQSVEIYVEDQEKTETKIIINGITVRFFLAEIDKKLILWTYIGYSDYLDYYDFIKN